MFWWKPPQIQTFKGSVFTESNTKNQETIRESPTNSNSQLPPEKSLTEIRGSEDDSVNMFSYKRRRERL